MSMSGKEEEGGSNEHIATDKDFYYYETDHQTLPDDQAATADYGPDPEEVEDEGRNRDLNDNEPTVSALDEVFYDSSDRDPLPNASVHGHPDPGMSVMDGTDNKDPDPDVSVAPAAESPIAADAAIKSEKRIPPISPIVKVTQRESLFTPLTNLAASGSKPMKKFPPPYPQLIYGYHRNDILSGRGATINAHPGNKHFRVMCAHRKSEFEPATNSQKRQIAFEIVQAVMKWNPPGRFIERAERNAKCTAEDVDAFFREVDVNRVLVGSSAAYFHQMGYSLKRNRKLKRELGPWKDIGIEMAIQKAMSVIRDHDRADRIALRAMGMLRRKKLKTYPVFDALCHITSAANQFNLSVSSRRYCT